MEGDYLFPGYMIFESSVWNEIEKKWIFLPRRASKDSYDELMDEKRATNLLITTDEHFNEVVYKKIGEPMPLRGYSTFKFVPNTNNQLIIALKTEEDSGKTRSFATLFDLNGNILVKDRLISDSMKYEGIEFV
jgi:soluble calcium-activated nucleotidase 1